MTTAIVSGDTQGKFRPGAGSGVILLTITFLPTWHYYACKAGRWQMNQVIYSIRHLVKEYASRRPGNP
jgi:hypothetical protein